MNFDLPNLPSDHYFRQALIAEANGNKTDAEAYLHLALLEDHDPKDDDYDDDEPDYDAGHPDGKTAHADRHN